MKFELKHIMEVNDKELLENVNLYIECQVEEDNKFEKYVSLDDVPTDILLTVLEYHEYLDMELENICIEDLSVVKL